MDNLIRLDANENIFANETNIIKKAKNAILNSNFTLYPDFYAETLVKSIADFVNLEIENIIAGLGSDQILDTLLRTYSGENARLGLMEPTFGMFKVFADWNKIPVSSIKTDEKFNISIEDFADFLNRERATITIIANPNNPTGILYSRDDIKKLFKLFPGIIVIDEAYHEFSGMSVIDLVEEEGYRDRLVVTRTFSKAMGLAGMRVGYGAASKGIMGKMSPYKMPYSLTVPSTIAAITVLEDTSDLMETVKIVISERDRMIKELDSLSDFYITPSQANFLYIKTKKALEIFEALKEKRILIRNYDNKEVIRITVGEKVINDIVLETIKIIEGAE